MRKFIYFLLILLEACCSGGAEEKSESAKGSWVDSRRMEIYGWRSLNKRERFDKLTSRLEGIGRLGEGMSENQRAIYSLVLDEILSDPGIGEYYEDKIDRLKSSLRDQGNKTSYNFQRVFCFEEMKQIPSAEIVKVLGELLDDKEDKPPSPREGQDYVEQGANNLLAAAALGALVANPPVKKDHLHPYFEDDIEVWKLWYAQVKAGTRGFQFKDDDKVHYLANPAKEERRPPGKLTDADPVNSSPAVVSPSPNVSRSPEKRNSGLIPSLIALGVLLFSAGWLAVSKRRTKPAN